jgi:hypothetical protein
MSLEYQKHVFARTLVTTSLQPGALTIEVHAPTGTYRVDPRAYEFRVHLDRAPKAVRIDRAAASRTDSLAASASIHGAAWAYDASARVLVILTDPSRKPLATRVDVVPVYGFAPR